ncbi:MAG: hypothetical protein GOMPHAMPRED_007961 [Gomphillus americanus]|uniref:Uncharacterized protein n=1 Tax=Gomphillus americanus TaxID=1940652 RepID=A0A8H3I3F2_9LECA|nr:MAG: hypothetical protein GOMPHAMPRED_007961 [Gomphillus americanus]
MSRRLQDCLALASYKNRHGFDRMSFSYVEAQYHDQLRKQSDTSSSSASSSSSMSVSDYPTNPRQFQSSPLTSALFSDDIYHRNSPFGQRKRARFQQEYLGPTPRASRRRSKKRTATSHQVSPTKGWATSLQLSTSSPLAARSLHAPSISFATTTMPQSPQFGLEDDEPRLPPTFHSSPPRTPPRVLRSIKTSEGEGADLLLFLATSPSPANSRTLRGFAPCTPPSKHAQLPSSMLNTPGNTFGLFNTPGQNFNFADFVNVTPSPAQGAFGGMTPGPAKTPLAVKEARRTLTFGSPTIARKHAGLGMELGEELRS